MPFSGCNRSSRRLWRTILYTAVARGSSASVIGSVLELPASETSVGARFSHSKRPPFSPTAARTFLVRVKVHDRATAILSRHVVRSADAMLDILKEEHFVAVGGWAAENQLVWGCGQPWDEEVERRGGTLLVAHIIVGWVQPFT